MSRLSVHALVLTAAVATIGIALPAAAGTVITLSDQPAPLAGRAAAAPVAASGLVPAGSAFSEPAPGPWIVPFIVDVGNPSGTTTLLSVRNENELPGSIDVEVEFVDDDLMEFHSVTKSLAPNQLQSYNLRDQPGLAGSGLQYGFVRVTAPPGERISVDYFVVTPGDDFASGGLGIDFTIEECQRWKVRVLEGGPFSGGTSLLFLINGPRGTGMGALPTITGNVYAEDGTFVNSFSIFTSRWVRELDAADLIVPASLFGAFELTIDATLGGGWVVVEHRAEGRYAVSVPGSCRDSVPVP